MDHKTMEASYWHNLFAHPTTTQNLLVQLGTQKLTILETYTREGRERERGRDKDRDRDRDSRG